MWWMLLAAQAAPEICNGEDDDGDDLIDEGPVAAAADKDEDGFGTDDEIYLFASCSDVPSDLAQDISDCDDSDEAIHPGAPETCDARDEDCDGAFDDGACDGEVDTEDDEAWLVITTQLDWYGALEACEEVGWQLATIEDEQQMEGLWWYAGPHGIPFWIGLTDAFYEGDWNWVSGASLDYFENWDYGEPNDYGYIEDCGALRTEGTWDDRPCDNSYAYVCERECSYRIWYVDEDGDGLGSPDYYDSDDECETYDGRVANAVDCDDGDPSQPGLWYLDEDGDGYGTDGFVACWPDGAIQQGGDCDDLDRSLNPGAEDPPGDGLDTNCDGGDGTVEPPDPTDEGPDGDGDGLSDSEEEELGTDPSDPDSDGDGVFDGIDPDPLDAGGASDARRPEPNQGCGCRAEAPPAAPLALLAALAAIRRRSRLHTPSSADL